MYNGIGLTSARGSGTNGYVQRNLAHVKTSKEKPNYRTEEEIKKADAVLNRQPNKEILEHEKQRKVEVKCFELRELMENQGYDDEEIDNKVNQYRELLKQQMAISEGPTSETVDEYGRPTASETHQIAELQQEKNSRLKNAFGIDKDYVDGSAIERNTLKSDTVKLKPGKADARRDHDNRTIVKEENVSVSKEKPIEQQKNETEKPKRDRKVEKHRSKEDKQKLLRKKHRKRKRSSSSSSSSSEQSGDESSSSSDDDSSSTTSSSSSSSDSDEKSSTSSSSSSSSSSTSSDDDEPPTAKKRKRVVEQKKSSTKSKVNEEKSHKYERSKKESASRHRRSRSVEKKHSSRRDDRTPPKKRH